MAAPRPTRDLENLAGTLKVRVPQQLGRVIAYGVALRGLAANTPRRRGKRIG